MMSKILIGIFIMGCLAYAVLFSLLSSLNTYKIEGDKVIYQYFDNSKWKTQIREVAGADSKSFKAFSFYKGMYGKDANQGYFEGRPIEGSNGKSFRVLDHSKSLSRDNQAVFYKERLLSNDHSHFQALGGAYFKDSSKVFYGWKIVENADPSSFEVTDEVSGKAKDKNYTYKFGDIISSVSPIPHQAVSR